MALLWKVSSVAGTGGWSVTGTGGLVSHRYWRFGQSQVLEDSSFTGTGGFVSHIYWSHRCFRQSQVVSSVTCTGVTGAFVSHRWFRQSHVLESQVLSSVTGGFVSHRY